MMPRERPIRVLHVITGLNVGGAERMLVKLLAGFDRREIESTVVSLTGEGALAGAVREAGATLHELRMAGARDLPRALRQLRPIVHSVQPDVLQSWLYHADLLTTLARGAAREAPLVWTLRCSNMDLERYGIGTRIVRWLLARLSRRPDLILANSRAGLDWHVAFGYHPRATDVIPNGFDVARFRPDPEARARLRRELGIGTDTVLVGTVARVDAMKDYPNLLAAGAQLAARDPRVHLVAIGKDTETLLPGPPALAGRLHALGVRSDVERLLPGLDVFCLASAFGEGFPNVLGEAMACGVPAVVTDVGDAAAILGACGRVVPPGDPDALASGIGALLALDSNERASLGRAAAEHIRSNYEIGAVVERFAALYRKLAAAPR